MLEKSVRLRTKQQTKTTLSHAYTIIKNRSNNKSFKKTEYHLNIITRLLIGERVVKNDYYSGQIIIFHGSLGRISLFQI